MITYKSLITKIVLDLKLPNEKKYHKDIVLDYIDDDKDVPYLTMSDIHYEENDSWNAIDLDDVGFHADIHFYGEDDSLSYNERTEEDYDDRKAMTIPIHYCLWGVEENEDGFWEHTDEYFDGASIRNVRVYTNDGMKRIHVVQH